MSNKHFTKATSSTHPFTATLPRYTSLSQIWNELQKVFQPEAETFEHPVCLLLYLTVLLLVLCCLPKSWFLSRPEEPQWLTQPGFTTSFPHNTLRLFGFNKIKTCDSVNRTVISLFNFYLTNPSSFTRICWITHKLSTAHEVPLLLYCNTPNMNITGILHTLFRIARWWPHNICILTHTHNSILFILFSPISQICLRGLYNIYIYICVTL